MEFDSTTFVLEVLNFLVLVWLLKRFFYQPVLGVIEARQAATAQIMSDAKRIEHEAEVLKSTYENRLFELEKEHATAKARIGEEIAVERTRHLALLESDIATERKRREALQEREHSELEQTLERQALQLAQRFCTRFLEPLSGPDQNAKLADLAVSELEGLPDDKKDLLRSVLGDTKVAVQLLSAYPLDESQRTAFSDVLSRLAGRPVVPEFGEEPLLKAGVSIMAGSWVVMANLRDELSFFSGNLAHES